MSGGKGSGNVQSGKSIFGLEDSAFYDLCFPKESYLQNKVMNLALDDTRLMYFAFPYPELKDIGPPKEQSQSFGLDLKYITILMALDCFKSESDPLVLRQIE